MGLSPSIAIPRPLSQMTSPLVRLSRLLFRPYKMPGYLEDQAAMAFFEDRQQGYFVDVGANHGGYTLPFEKAGWDGVLIEPLPDLAENLRRTRKAAVAETVCTEPEQAGGTVTFYRGEATGLSTMHPDEPSQRGIAESIERPAATLDSVLEAHGAPDRVDLVKLDVEMHELPVLKGFDFARWNPALIVVEDHAYDHRLHRYISGNGYRYYARYNLNSWYVPENSPHKASALMRYAFFRKYYLGLPPRALKRAIRKRRRARVLQSGGAGF
jgi:FkbM family methyltransferase